MAFDLHSDRKNITGLNSPLFPNIKEVRYHLFYFNDLFNLFLQKLQAQTNSLNIESIVNFWINNGAPINKLVLGIASYGRSFTLANPVQNRLGDLKKGDGLAQKVKYIFSKLFFFKKIKY